MIRTYEPTLEFAHGVRSIGWKSIEPKRNNVWSNPPTVRTVTAITRYVSLADFDFVPLSLVTDSVLPICNTSRSRMIRLSTTTLSCIFLHQVVGNFKTQNPSQLPADQYFSLVYNTQSPTYMNLVLAAIHNCSAPPAVLY